MKRSGISRRDCLALLGAGAAATISTAMGETKLTAAKAGVGDSAQRHSSIAMQSAQEELKELGAVPLRAYAPTPVQSRPEQTAASLGGGGWQINLREGWEMVETDDALPPGQYAADSKWIKTQMPRPVQYALMEAGEVPNLWYGDNFKKLQWIQKRDWYLRRRLVIPGTCSGGQRLISVCGLSPGKSMNCW